MKKNIKFYILSLIFLSGCTSSTTNDKLIDGVYLSQLESEGSTNKNCLVIVTVKNKHYIYFNSAQAGGYSCNIEGGLVIKNGRYFWPDWFANNNVDGVYLYPNNKSRNIVIKAVHSKSNRSMQYCGVHASIETIKLQLQHKFQMKNRDYFNLDTIGNYCE
jgi:hypothetical protein